VKRLLSATINSLHGIAYGIRSEAALREEIIVLVLAVPAGVFVAPNAAWYTAMVGVILLLIAVEFLNTAIEKLADHVTREQHHEIRRIKDFGSAAVFSTIALCGIVWLAAIAVRCRMI